MDIIGYVYDMQRRGIRYNSAYKYFKAINSGIHAIINSFIGISLNKKTVNNILCQIKVMIDKINLVSYNDGFEFTVEIGEISDSVYKVLVFINDFDHILRNYFVEYKFGRGA